MTDELLPALPESELWTYGGEARPMKPAYTEDQMRAYAREAIRLSHTWPTLRDDDAMTHPHLEGLIRKWRDNATAMRSNQPLPSWQRAEELEGCADELEAALAALPGGGVDGLARELIAAAKSAWSAEYGDEDWTRLRAATFNLERALPTPNPHEADRNGND